MRDIDLDLHECDLFGWEFYKDIEKVERFMIEIEGGRKFRPVYVRRINEFQFSLDSTFIDPITRESFDGGHNRAIAYYLSNRPLPIFLTDSPEDKRLAQFHIREIALAIKINGEVQREICLVKHYQKGKPWDSYLNSQRSLHVPF